MKNISEKFVFQKHFEGGPSGASEETKKAPLDIPENLANQQKQEASDISNESKDSRNDIEIGITGKNLESIGVSSAEAFNLGKKVLEIKGTPLNLKEMKDKVKEFQSKNGLDMDGKIGKFTYLEMYRLDLNSELETFNKKGDLTDEVMKKIRFSIDNPTNSESMGVILGHIAKQEKLNNGTPKYDKFFESLDENVQIGAKKLNEDPQFQEELNQENTTGSNLWKDLVKVFEGDMEVSDLLKNNKGTMTLAGILGFLFMWDKMTDGKLGTGSFLWRLAWLIGWSIFGGGDLIKYGLNKAVKAGTSAADAVAPNVKAAAEASTRATKKFLNITMPDLLDSVEWSDITSKVSTQFENIFTGFGSYNNTLVNNDGTPKEGFIPELPLSALSGLIHDDKFINLSKEDLQNIKDISSLNGFISAETQKKLEEANVSDQDINSFIQYHVLENAFWKEKDAKLVKDLIWTTSLQESYLSTKINWEFLWNDKKLDEIIKNDINFLINSLNSRDKNIGFSLIKSINSEEIDKFDIGNFQGISQEAQLKVQSIIDIVQNYNMAQDEIVAKLSLIDNIEPANKNLLQRETLESYLVALASIELAKDKITNVNVSEFTDAKSLKRTEILSWAKENGIEELTIWELTINVKDALKEETKKQENVKNKEKLLSIKIEKLPSIGSDPVEFKLWYNDHHVAFELAEQFRNDTNQDLQKIAQGILKQKQDFKERYIETKAEFLDKINQLRNQIANIEIDSQNTHSNAKEIERIGQEYAILLDRIISVDIQTIYDSTKSFISQISTPAIWNIDPRQNSFVYLDEKLSIEKPQKDVYEISIPKLLAGKLKESESSFIINPVKTDFYNSSVQSIDIWKLSIEVEQLQNAHLLISSFETDVKNDKIKIIWEEAKKIRTVFLTAINAANSKEELESMYTLYREHVQSQLGLYTNDDMWIFEGWQAYFNINGADVVKTNYENRLPEFSPKMQENIDSIEGLVPNIVSFLKKYNQANGVEAFHKINTETDTVQTLKNTLESFKSINWDNQELLNDANQILETIK